MAPTALSSVAVVVLAVASGSVAVARAQPIQFSHDGALIARLDDSVHQRPKVDVWTVDTGERRRIGPEQLIEKAHVLASAFAFSPTAPRLATVAIGFHGDRGVKELTVYDTTNWKVVSRIRKESRIVGGGDIFLSISPDGEQLAYLSSARNSLKGSIHSFDGEDWSHELGVSPQLTRSAGPITLLNRRSAVLIEPFVRRLRVVDTRTGVVTKLVAGACEADEATVFDGTAVISCWGQGGRLEWVDLPRGSELGEFVLGRSIGFATALPDRRFLLALSDKAYVIDRRRGAVVRTFPLEVKGPDGALSRDGSTLAALRWRGWIDLYDVAGGTFLKTLR
jgi:hypothetical protein